MMRQRREMKKPGPTAQEIVARGHLTFAIDLPKLVEGPVNYREVGTGADDEEEHRRDGKLSH